jgi:predicted membrane-bound spermidine synthase
VELRLVLQLFLELETVLGGGAGLAASMAPKIPKSVSAVAGVELVPLLKSYTKALADEGEELF